MFPHGSLTIIENHFKGIHSHIQSNTNNRILLNKTTINKYVFY